MRIYVKVKVRVRIRITAMSGRPVSGSVSGQGQSKESRVGLRFVTLRMDSVLEL